MEEHQHDTISLKYILRHKRASIFSAAVLLFSAFLLEYYASLYALYYSIRPTSMPVGDILLDNIPVVNLNFIIVEMALVAFILGAVFMLSQPRYILFSLKAFALFVAIRAVFISLTHVGIYPGHVIPGLGLFEDTYRYLNLQTGLFFSGHTGLPILMAFIFWKEKLPRMIFLVLGGIFGMAVLLAHVHYSIDVFAAPFMAYGIFTLSKHLFHHDYAFIESAPHVPGISP